MGIGSRRASTLSTRYRTHIPPATHLSLSVMLFSRVVSFATFFLTLGILAVAKPVEVESRADASSVANVVATLKSKTDQIVPQISKSLPQIRHQSLIMIDSRLSPESAAANPHANPATITPLINELVSALNTAQNSLARGPVIGLKSRQAQEEVANTFAGVVTVRVYHAFARLSTERITFQDITGAIKVIPFGFPGLTGLILSLDFALAAVIRGLDFTLIGLGFAVGSLYVIYLALIRAIAYDHDLHQAQRSGGTSCRSRIWSHARPPWVVME